MHNVVFTLQDRLTRNNTFLWCLYVLYEVTRIPIAISTIHHVDALISTSIKLHNAIRIHLVKRWQIQVVPSIVNSRQCCLAAWCCLENAGGRHIVMHLLIYTVHDKWYVSTIMMQWQFVHYTIPQKIPIIFFINFIIHNVTVAGFNKSGQLIYHHVYVLAS